MVGQGTTLKGRWKLSKKIGQGAFGEIYNGVDITTQDPVVFAGVRCVCARVLLEGTAALASGASCPRVRLCVCVCVCARAPARVRELVSLWGCACMKTW